MDTHIVAGVWGMGLSDPEAGSRTRLAWNSVGPVSTMALALGLVLLTLAPVARAERLDDPIELGSIDTPGTARGVSVVGGLAYVADNASGLRVIDVSNPAAPIEVGSIDTPDFARDVADSKFKQRFLHVR